MHPLFFQGFGETSTGPNACKQYFALLSYTRTIIAGTLTSSGQFALNEHFGTCCYRLCRV